MGAKVPELVAGVIILLVVFLYLGSLLETNNRKVHCEAIGGEYGNYWYRNLQTGATKGGYFCLKWDMFYSWNGSGWEFEEYVGVVR